MLYAINPYSFVPFCGESFDDAPARKKLSEYYTEGELQSGWIDVELITKSQIIVPDGSDYDEIDLNRKDQKKHKVYSFFRHPDGTYAIPGSELRGSLRSMYEAASNSCFPFLLEDKKPISQRTPIYGAFKERGLLEFDSGKKVWRLYKTKKHIITTTGTAVETGVFRQGGVDYRTADEVKFLDTGDKVTLGSGNLSGYLQFNIPVVRTTRKNGEVIPVAYHVAVLEKGNLEYEWAAGDDDAYRSILSSVHDTVKNVDNKPTTQKDLEVALDHAAKGHGNMVPVYYFRVERDIEPLYYLSGAAVGRVHQKRKWPDIMGDHAPCKTLDCLCPACALFGTVQGDGTKGRLRITDARATTDVKTEKHTLEILGGPRSSSFEFYLRRPKTSDGDRPTYWNYDYYGVRVKFKTRTGESIERTEYHDLPAATPRGRKFYWHGNQRSDRNVQDHMNSTMEAVDEGAVFKFRIYFDRITQAQLDELLWTITLGENTRDSRYQYKLGHAKPLGYGSVKMVVTDCVKRSVSSVFSVSTEHIIVPDKPSCDFPVESKTIQSILRISDCTATRGENVEYLTGAGKVRGEEVYMIYNWFQKNRMNADSVLTLPEPWDNSLTLPTRRRDGVTVGCEVGGTVEKVFGFGAISLRLSGSRKKGFYRYGRNAHYTEGDKLRVKILSYDEEHHSYQVVPVR